jgi:hypothetical protein
MNTITFQKFHQLHNGGFTLDQFYLLLQIEKGEDVKSLCKGSLKLETLYQGLYRKGLITEEQKITLTGKELIKFTTEEDENSEETKVPRKKVIDGFDLWWKTYPGTDTFVYSGKTFSGTRSLRTKKEDCKKKFNNILEEGEYTVQELVDALKFETDQKKMNSVKEKTNKLTYMQNSLTYLNQRTFEPFIELVRAGIKVVEQINTGGTDI